jgi:hypothetical protein
MRWIAEVCLLLAVLPGIMTYAQDTTAQDKMAQNNLKLKVAAARATDVIVAKVDSVSVTTNAATNITMTCQIKNFRPICGTNNWMGSWVVYDETVAPSNSCGSKLERIVKSGQNWILFMCNPRTIIRAEQVSKVRAIQDLVERN